MGANGKVGVATFLLRAWECKVWQLQPPLQLGIAFKTHPY